jgi:ribosomal protein S18 acetylase RimI-like enzyme
VDPGAPEPISIVVRDFVEADLPWADAQIKASFGSRHQARLGELVDPLAFPGLVAEVGGQRAGIITIAESPDDVEIVAIAATEPLRGIGSALLARAPSRAAGRRLWLVTTNDNLDALRFYQRRGFRLTEVRSGAVDWARDHLKPSLPRTGAFGIRVCDELVLDHHPLDDG